MRAPGDAGGAMSLFQALGLDADDRPAVAAFAARSGVPVAQLRYYDTAQILPCGADLARLLTTSGLSEMDLMLRLGRPSRAALAALAGDAGGRPAAPPPPAPRLPPPVLATAYGQLYQGDCLAIMAALASDSLDLIFADPPQNLGKWYPSGINDRLAVGDYLAWCERWLLECIRLLKPGGALFVWNLPRWNAELASFLAGRLTLLHWIAVEFKCGLPRPGRLYPAHYALLYLVKGPRPRVFHPDRLPLAVCRHCAGELGDYGGHARAMNPAGVNLSDVWHDIHPVRHAKYKRRTGANELPLRLLDRIIELASDPGDTVLDPFGGAGTTYVAAEVKQRRWLGVEIGPPGDIQRRFAALERERHRLAAGRQGLNTLFPPAVKARRERAGRWT